MEILGSIDNAFHVGFGPKSGVFHLIFTTHKLIAAQVMNSRERRQRLMIAENTPLNAISPMLGAVSTYKEVKNETMAMLEDGLGRGLDIEKNLGKYLETSHEGLITLNYEAVNRVEFRHGTKLRLASLEFSSNGRKWKYHLIHNNFQKSGKLDEDTLQKYTKILEMAFQEKLKIS